MIVRNVSRLDSCTHEIHICSCLLRKIRMSPEGSVDPPKSFPYPSLSMCLSSASGETSSLWRR
jgi:hypothetical protein